MSFPKTLPRAPISLKVETCQLPPLLWLLSLAHSSQAPQDLGPETRQTHSRLRAFALAVPKYLHRLLVPFVLVFTPVSSVHSSWNITYTPTPSTSFPSFWILFSPHTLSNSIFYFSILLFVFVCLPLLEGRDFCLFCSLLCFWCLEQILTHNRCLRIIC